MARVLKSNRLSGQKTSVAVSVSDIYSNFLRSSKGAWSSSTYKIYQDVGNRHIIPKLTKATGDDMQSVSRETIQLILDEYAESHKAGGTDFLFRHLKAFINWYWEEYEIPGKNPMAKVKIKKVSNPPKEGITQEEVDALLKAAKEHSQFPERDIALLMVLCDTGIRRGSLEKLRMKDVNIDKAEMVVFEKDQQYHLKSFGSATCKALKKYLLCLTDVSPDDPLWLQMDGRALTRVGMREVLRRLCSEAGIPRHEFHDFRRYYGKTLYESTHDIFMVSKALDHKDIYVTKRYIAIDDRENAETVRTYSPMDRRFRQTNVKVKRV